MSSILTFIVVTVRCGSVLQVFLVSHPLVVLERWSGQWRLCSSVRVVVPRRTRWSLVSIPFRTSLAPVTISSTPVPVTITIRVTSVSVTMSIRVTSIPATTAIRVTSGSISVTVTFDRSWNVPRRLLRVVTIVVIPRRFRWRVLKKRNNTRIY